MFTNDKHVQRVELLAQIAGFYFEENMTQNEIARRTGYSRSMISRLLAEARQEGVVEIRVNHPLRRKEDAEHRLADLYDLSAVRVLARGTMDDQIMLRRLGSLAAYHLETIVQNGMRIGVSWGTALWELTNAVHSHDYNDIKVVGLIGALGTVNAEYDGPEIARRLARTYGGHYHILPAPLIVDNVATQHVLMNDPSIQMALDLAHSVDLALVGIGSAEPNHSSLVRAGYISVQEMQSVRDLGIVGDVCAIHMDIEGRIANIPLNDRVVGIRPDKLRNIPLRMGIAGGSAKADAVLAACRSGLINILITDEIAAAAVIERSTRTRK